MADTLSWYHYPVLFSYPLVATMSTITSISVLNALNNYLVFSLSIRDTSYALLNRKTKSHHLVFQDFQLFNQHVPTPTVPTTWSLSVPTLRLHCWLEPWLDLPPHAFTQFPSWGGHFREDGCGSWRSIIWAKGHHCLSSSGQCLRSNHFHLLHQWPSFHQRIRDGDVRWWLHNVYTHSQHLLSKT